MVITARSAVFPYCIREAAASPPSEDSDDTVVKGSIRDRPQWGRREKKGTIPFSLLLTDISKASFSLLVSVCRLAVSIAFYVCIGFFNCFRYYYIDPMGIVRVCFPLPVYGEVVLYAPGPPFILSVSGFILVFMRPITSSALYLFLY